jgi:hypothetical protein|tara:strand:- start:364 stop:597 length:234 start_codon:yes stop_codon:yes gene_type:complete
MNAKLRIWRVVPTSETGAKAPYFFVETEEFKLEKAELAAKAKANEASGLSRFDNWHMSITRMMVRKDKFGRYWANHQ